MDYVESYYLAIEWPEIALGVGLLAFLLLWIWAAHSFFFG